MSYYQLNEFRHERLASPDRQIRLLMIEPSQGRRPTYTLETYLLHSRRCPNFYAVSYEWGSSDEMRHIEIGGKRFVIRANLRRFLRKLASSGEGFIRPLWIDAICIDQSNILEKNAQVGIMGEIYYTAELVLTWLGKNTAEVGTLTEATSRLETWQGSKGWTSFLDRARYQPSSSYQSDNDRETPLPALFSLKPPYGPMWSCINALCGQSYWTRLWIVQELVKAKKLLLMWGDEQIDWDSLSIAFRTIQLAYHTSSSSQYDTSPWALVRDSIPYKVWQHTQNLNYWKHTLLENMYTYRDSRCSRPHDKAYALRGISSDLSLLPIDYDTSLPDLYVNLMTLLPDGRYCIKYSHLILEALQVDEWSLMPGGGVLTSLKGHTVTCEAEHMGTVVAAKHVSISEVADFVEVEALEMLARAKLSLSPSEISRISQWIKSAHVAFQAQFRNDINQITYFALSNGQIGVTKSVILNGDSVCGLPSHLGDDTKVYLRLNASEDGAEDGGSVRSDLESPQLSSPTQSSFFSDLSMEMITRVWLLSPLRSTSLRMSRQTSTNRATVHIPYDALMALQHSLSFELNSPSSALPSATSSPTVRKASLNPPFCQSPVHDPATSFIDQALKNPISKPNSFAPKHRARASSGQIHVGSISRQLDDLRFNKDDSTFQPPR